MSHVKDPYHSLPEIIKKKHIYIYKNKKNQIKLSFLKILLEKAIIRLVLELLAYCFVDSWSEAFGIEKKIIAKML